MSRRRWITDEEEEKPRPAPPPLTVAADDDDDDLNDDVHDTLVAVDEESKPLDVMTSTSGVGDDDVDDDDEDDAEDEEEEDAIDEADEDSEAREARLEKEKEADEALDSEVEDDTVYDPADQGTPVDEDSESEQDTRGVLPDPKAENNALFERAKTVGADRAKLYDHAMTSSNVIISCIMALLIVSVLAPSVLPLLPTGNFFLSYSTVGVACTGLVYPLALVQSTSRRLPNPIVPIFFYYVRSWSLIGYPNALVFCFNPPCVNIYDAL